MSETTDRTRSEIVKGTQSLLIVHVVNRAALVILGTILLIAATIRPYHAIVVLPVLVFGILYQRLRNRPKAVACYFGISLVVFFWIVLCENIVTIDELLGTNIARKLSLGYQLQGQVDRAKSDAARFHRFEPCCGDPTSVHYRPGSNVRGIFDCETCSKPYDRIADETGYLNRRHGLWASSAQIDLFLAGDSGMQGIGVPSVLEFVERRIPLVMWNVSIAGYGTRDKVNALLTYALPKQPRWIILEFYSANDPADALKNEACEGAPDFRCRFSDSEIRRRLLLHPTYADRFRGSLPSVGIFESYTQNSLTLAATSYLIDALKTAVKEKLLTSENSHTQAGAGEVGDGIDLSHLRETGLLPIGNASHPGEGRLFPLESLNYTKIAMEVVRKNYETLLRALSTMSQPPKVILLYNPSCYEVYRNILLQRDTVHDQVSQFQLEWLRAFAEKHGWKFLDLTVALRASLAESKTWIYGRYDTHHWSPEGTAFVGEVLSKELSRIIKEKEHEL